MMVLLLAVIDSLLTPTQGQGKAAVSALRPCLHAETEMLATDTLISRQTHHPIQAQRSLL